MPNFLNQYHNGPVSCEAAFAKVPYEDNSIYFEDASIFVQAVDMKKIQKAVADQLFKVGEYANSEIYSSEDFLKEVERLREIARVYLTIERLANK
ncbi:hypothetical protein [Gorillibacterium sp. sgz5001074]|uniref:hypothetical protein n=1 Tax=Gorillibacterium sp. sgz5001074 TaxID=3446695 RepID=UPI003F67354C